MTVQAKVRCISNVAPHWDAEGSSQRVVRFTPVYDADPAHPNFAWSQATPSGYVELTITNPGAFGAFEVNAEYTLTFDEARVPA